MPMIYLDYSATTGVSKEVLNAIKSDLFTCATLDDLTMYKNKIKSILNTSLSVYFTSSSSESNNMAIKGVCASTSKRTIITTEMEHSSIAETLKFLENLGFKIVYVPFVDGELSMSHFEKLIDSDVALISISSVNSETGVVMPVSLIGDIAKKNNIPFHCDMTGSITHIPISFDNIDFITFSAHKFYGPSGIGVLLANDNIPISKLIYGDRKYNLGLVKGLVLALENSYSKMTESFDIVNSLSMDFKNKLSSIPNVYINEGKNYMPHVVNISILSYKPETFLHYLELNDIYISTKSACSSKDSYSKAVYALTGDMERAKTSVRISISSSTKKEELDKVIELIKRGEYGR